jgi:hypothetical protein
MGGWYKQEERGLWETCVMEPTMSGSGVEGSGGTPLGGVVRIDDERIQAHRMRWYVRAWKRR